jgi:hypothetical protein
MAFYDITYLSRLGGIFLPSTENVDHTRRSQFRRKKKRSRYYTASLVLAILFLVLAMAFPIYLDLMRKERGAQVGMAGGEQSEAQMRASPAPVQVALATGFTNIQCQAYVTARCNALGMGTAWCGEALAEALKLRNASSVDDCRLLVEKKINEAFALYKATAGARDVVEADASDALLSWGGAQAERDAGAGLPDKGVEARKDASQAAKEEKAEKGTGKMSRQEQEKNLKEIYRLIEEIQVGALNYVTPTPMQRARFEELRKRVEADGSEEVIKLYNDVIARYGRTGGFGAQRGASGASGAGERVEASVGENRSRESQELRTVRGIMEQRGFKPPEEPTEPRSIDPSEAQAPPARSF